MNTATGYKYIDKVSVARELGLVDEKARKVHMHAILVDGKWVPLFGASTVKGIVGDKSKLFQYHADRAAVCALGLPENDITEEFEAIQKISDGWARSAAMKDLLERNPDFKYARLAPNRHRDNAAESGTERHASLEDYIRACIQEGGAPMLVDMELYAPEIRSFIAWAFENVAEFYFTEAHGYSQSLWIGGIADLGLRLKDGRRLVGDHKSSREAYADQFLQCAIYDQLLIESGGLDRDGNKLFDWEPADGYVVFPFRSDPFTPEFRWNADEYRKGVEGVAHLYRLLA